MRAIVLATASLFLSSFTAHAEKLVLTGGTIINPGTGEVRVGHVYIDGDRISSISNNHPLSLASDTRQIDCNGKFILPGYIDTHVHFFQSGGLFTRPDIVDLTKVRPYAAEIAWIQQHLRDTFARYLRSGITSVVDVGGPFWNFRLRKLAKSAEKAPRVAVAGPLISSVARPQLDLGDPPIIKIDTPEQGRALVQKLAKRKPDYVKIWYVVDDEHPLEKFRPVVRAVIEASHAGKLRVAVHATELETARAAVEEGADLLVHSVNDKEVDDRFVKLLKERGTMLTPTLVVFERYGRTFANKLNLTAEEKAWGDPEVIATLDGTKLPPDQLPERIKTALADPGPALDRIKKIHEVALKNLKRLQDGGVTVATGTDAGNIGTIHGPAIFREFQLMKEAGLTPMQILKATTANAAQVFGGDIGGRIGSIEKGKFADLVILKSNPIEDIARTSDIDSVIKGGVVYSADSLAKDSSENEKNQ